LHQIGFVIELVAVQAQDTFRAEQDTRTIFLEELIVGLRRMNIHFVFNA